MPLREPIRVDPQEPSTSTGPQRRLDENLRKFDELFSKTPPTLWEVCAENQRGRLVKTKYSTELRSLRGVNFKEILKSHQTVLNDLARISGTTFGELCEGLQFLVHFKKIPIFKTKKEDALEFFQLVCNCIHFSNDRWTNVLDSKNLLNPRTTDLVKKSIARSKCPLPPKGGKEGDEVIETAATSSLFPPSKHTTPSPVTRLQDREKVPIPPPPSVDVLYKGPFNVLEDEYLRPIHRFNFSKTTDNKFTVVHEKLLKQVTKNNGNIRVKELELSDLDYYQDDKDIQPTQISFRLDSVVQIVHFDLPKVEDDGYFSPNLPSRGWYLLDKYMEANVECTEAFKHVRPNGRPMKPGFKRGVLHAHECLQFHMAGRHIHGFFDVWEESERGWQLSNGKWINRRYLVDIYNQLMFPLYVEWCHWSATLRWAFEKYSWYGLRLMSMVKRHGHELRNAGDLLFSRYPRHITDTIRYDLTTTKGRNQFYTAIQQENNTVVDRFVVTTLHSYDVHEDGRRRKRRAPKSDEMQLLATGTPPKMSRSPRKALEPPQKLWTGVHPTRRSVNPQKENMDKYYVNPTHTSPHMPSTSQPSILNRTPPTPGFKRKIAENGHHFTPVSHPPPAKKLSITLDSWDNHRAHDAIEEEHVDETEENPNEEDCRQNVWVPQDRGQEVPPEDYAREIIDHFQGRENEPALKSEATPPSIPAPKPRRRKSNTKTSLEPPSPSVEPEKTTLSTNLESTKPPTSTVPTPLSAVSALTVTPSPSNGHLLVPPGKTVSKQTTRVQYSMKPPIPPSANKTVYPVKKLANSSPIVMNGAVTQTKYPAASLASGTPSIGSRPHPYGVQQKAPYYPAGMRSRVAQQTTPYVVHNQENGAFKSTPLPPISTPLPPHRTPLQSYQTPASRAIQNQKNGVAGTDLCRRVMPFNLSMALWAEERNREKNLLPGDPGAFPTRQWPPPSKIDTPINPPTPTVPYQSQRATSSGPPPVDYRSFSNVTRPASNTPPLAAPTVCLPPPHAPAPSNALERSVGVTNTRQERPSVANSRALVDGVAATVNGYHPTTSSTPLPATIPMGANPMVTTRMAPVSVAADLNSISLRKYSHHFRKQNGTMTPEQIGNAIRNESQRFQEDNNGAEGPTVRTFLMNLKN
ncbi:hypothetical protein GCK72_013546 [Caenorhabditis remanei]|uniref:Uncharacterized protein n=1 Tax=Caenorhabditis remanei TaxID=31234 RepID=A0A6A5GQZ2_CAERE|nr:hypothetical protein GCK72_013546 [Caenorhabditis remanei]KAF1757091.1 hypothetical protein GCK72_013546 [Caenorhabditis remanei]